MAATMLRLGDLRCFAEANNAWDLPVVFARDSYLYGTGKTFVSSAYSANSGAECCVILDASTQSEVCLTLGQLLAYNGIVGQSDAAGICWVDEISWNAAQHTFAQFIEVIEYNGQLVAYIR